MAEPDNRAVVLKGVRAAGNEAAGGRAAVVLPGGRAAKVALRGSAEDG